MGGRAAVLFDGALERVLHFYCGGPIPNAGGPAIRDGTTREGGGRWTIRKATGGPVGPPSSRGRACSRNDRDLSSKIHRRGAYGIGGDRAFRSTQGLQERN